MPFKLPKLTLQQKVQLQRLPQLTLPQLSKLRVSNNAKIQAEKKAEEARIAASQSNYVDYNDPNAINSIADVYTRTKLDNNPTGAIAAVGGILSFTGDIVTFFNPIAGIALKAAGKITQTAALVADKDFRKYVKDAYIKPIKEKDSKAVVYNLFQNFAETADVLAQNVKAFSKHAGGDAEQGLANLNATIAGALGQETELGRKNYDYNTGSLILDMTLEVVSDPLTIVELGTGAIELSASKIAKKVVGEAAGKAVAKTGVQLTESKVKQFVKQRVFQPFVNIKNSLTDVNKASAKLQERITKTYDTLYSNKYNELVKKGLSADYLKNNDELLAITTAKNLRLKELADEDFITDSGAFKYVAEVKRYQAVDAKQLPKESSTEAILNELKALDYSNLLYNKLTGSDILSDSKKYVNELKFIDEHFKKESSLIKKRKAYLKTRLDEQQLYVGVKQNVKNSVAKDLLSDEVFAKLVSQSTQNASDTALLKGIGKVNGIVLNTTKVTRYTADAFDKQIFQNALGPVYITGKLVGKGIKASAGLIKKKRIAAAINKHLHNETAAFFKKYYTADNTLDLSRFETVINDFKDFSYKNTTMYSDKGYSEFINYADISTLVSEINKSFSKIAEGVDAFTNTKDLSKSTDKLLEFLNKQLPNVDVSKATTLEEKLKLYAKYLSNFKDFDNQHLINDAGVIRKIYRASDSLLEVKAREDLNKYVDFTNILKNSSFEDLDKFVESLQESSEYIKTFEERTHNTLKTLYKLQDTRKPLSAFKNIDSHSIVTFEKQADSVLETLRDLQKIRESLNTFKNTGVKIPKDVRELLSVPEHVFDTLKMLYDLKDIIETLSVFKNTDFKTFKEQANSILETLNKLQDIKELLNALKNLDVEIPKDFFKHLELYKKSLELTATYNVFNNTVGSKKLSAQHMRDVIKALNSSQKTFVTDMEQLIDVLINSKESIKRSVAQKNETLQNILNAKKFKEDLLNTGSDKGFKTIIKVVDNAGNTIYDGTVERALFDKSAVFLHPIYNPFDSDAVEPFIKSYNTYVENCQTRVAEILGFDSFGLVNDNYYDTADVIIKYFERIHVSLNPRVAVIVPVTTEAVVKALRLLNEHTPLQNVFKDNIQSILKDMNTIRALTDHLYIAEADDVIEKAALLVPTIKDEVLDNVCYSVYRGPAKTQFTLLTDSTLNKYVKLVLNPSESDDPLADIIQAYNTRISGADTWLPEGIQMLLNRVSDEERIATIQSIENACDNIITGAKNYMQQTELFNSVLENTVLQQEGATQELKMVVLDTLQRYYSTDVDEIIADANFDSFFNDFITQVQTNLQIRNSDKRYSLDALVTPDETLKAHTAFADVQRLKKLSEERKLIPEDDTKINAYVDFEFLISDNVNTKHPFEIGLQIDGGDSLDIKVCLNEDELLSAQQNTFDFLMERDNVTYDAKRFKDNYGTTGPDTKEAFLEFFKKLLNAEQSSENIGIRNIRIIAHNATTAELPIIRAKFNQVKKELVSEGYFKTMLDANEWLDKLCKNSIDTLSEIHKLEKLPTVTPEQVSAIRNILNTHINNKVLEGGSQLARSVTDDNFAGLYELEDILSSLNKTAPTIKNKTKITARVANDDDDVFFEATELTTVNEFENAIKYHLTTLRNSLSTAKSDLFEYYIDPKLFSAKPDAYKVYVKKGDDEIFVPTITALNKQMNLNFNEIGLRRINTSDTLLVYGKNNPVTTKELSKNNAYSRTLKNRAKSICESVSKIRYPSVLSPHAAHITTAWAALKSTIREVPSNVPGYKMYLSPYLYLAPTDNIVLEFVEVRKMYNALKKFDEEHNTEYRYNLNTSEALLKLIDGSDSEALYTTTFRNTESSVKKVIQSFDSELEKVKGISEMLEAQGGAVKPYASAVKASLGNIGAIVNKIKKQQENVEYLKNYQALLQVAPHMQVKNRFADFNATKAEMLFRDLLYNPLHLLPVSTIDLKQYNLEEIQRFVKEQNIETIIKDDTVYFYLPTESFSKYTYNKSEGVWQKGLDVIARAEYDMSYLTERDDYLKELILEMQTTFENVPFSDSMYRTLNESDIKQIYDNLPVELQNALGAYSDLDIAQYLNGGDIFNNILIGNTYRQGLLLKNAVYVQDPIANAIHYAKSKVSDFDTRTQWLHYLFDPTDSLTIINSKDGLLENILLKDTSIESVTNLCAALEYDNNYCLTALLNSNSKKGAIDGFQLCVLPLSNPAFVKQFIDRGVAPIKLMTHAQAQTVRRIIANPKRSKLGKLWRDAIKLFKSAVLFSTGTIMRNMLDPVLKTTITEGPTDTINYTVEAMYLYKQYTDVVKRVTSSSYELLNDAKTCGLLNNDSLDYVFAHAKEYGLKLDRETFDFIHAFKTSDASAAMLKPLENQKRYKSAFLESEFHKNNPNATLEDWLKNNKKDKWKFKKSDGVKAIRRQVSKNLEGTYSALVSLMMTPAAYVEEVNRLAIYLKYSDAGFLTRTDVFNKINKTHFNFNFKTDVASTIENVIPFFNFLKENAVFWMRMAEEHADIMYVLTNIMTPVWDLDSYTVEELTRNEYLAQQIIRGYVRINEEADLMLKINPSFMDVFSLFANPVEAFRQGLIVDLPETREALTQWEGGLKDTLIDNAKNIPILGTAGQRIETGIKNVKRINAKTQSSELGVQLSKMASTVSSTFAVPVRYRQGSYDSSNYYKRYQNYRRPVSTYTPTGISKMRILMQPVSPQNIKYKLGIMQSYVNKQ